MKIVSLEAENVKRLKAVYIEPDGTLQVVSGRNAQGKTSVLDAIWLALGGGAAMRDTAKPIRDGADTASVTLDLGDIVVTRTWKNDKTNLEVKSKDGARYTSPQSMLDALVGRLSFDPLAFTRLSAKEQKAALLDLVDLDVDLDALAAERARLYDQRTEVGRQEKAYGTTHVSEDLPTEEESAAQIVAQIREANELVATCERTIQAHERAQQEVRNATERLAEAQRALDQAKAVLAERAEDVAALPTTRPDVAAMEERLATVEERNAAIRANNAARDSQDRAKALRARYDDLTAKIEQIDQQRTEALASAQFPVEGLGFSDDGVTFQGVPFSQASSAEQIKVSLAMAMALNPKLRVIRILDGSLLDAESMAVIGEMAAEHDFQVWVERVADGTGVGVVIEDGQVAS